MDDFEIKKGFRDANDIDKLRVNIDNVSSWDNYITFLKEKKMRGLIIYSSSNVKRFVDFSFLKEMSFLEYFECLIPLTKISDINGIYFLSNLRNLRWLVDNNLNLDFSVLTKLEILTTSDYGGTNNWNNLMNLKKLYISKLKKDDCTFLSNLSQLIDLKLTRANIISIKGLEYCKKLERLELSYCLRISELVFVLENCSSINYISLVKCKNVKTSEIEYIKKLGISLWVE